MDCFIANFLSTELLKQVEESMRYDDIEGDPEAVDPLNLNGQGGIVQGAGAAIEQLMVMLQQQEQVQLLNDQRQLQRALLQAILARRPRTPDEFLAVLRQFLQTHGPKGRCNSRTFYYYKDLNAV